MRNNQVRHLRTPKKQTKKHELEALKTPREKKGTKREKKIKGNQPRR